MKDAVDVVMSVEGQISRSEARVLIQLAGMVSPNDVIVELGTYRGRSAVALARGSQLGNGNRVYAIDPHLAFQGVRGGHFGPEDMVALYDNLVRSQVASRVAVVCLPSVVVGKAWPDQNVGLLWIDGDHRYDFVRADFEAWFPHVTNGGVVAFHDSDALGVKQLLGEIGQAGELKIVDKVRLLTWFKKL